MITFYGNILCPLTFFNDLEFFLMITKIYQHHNIWPTSKLIQVPVTLISFPLNDYYGYAIVRFNLYISFIQISEYLVSILKIGRLQTEYNDIVCEIKKKKIDWRRVQLQSPQTHSYAFIIMSHLARNDLQIIFKEGRRGSKK